VTGEGINFDDAVKVIFPSPGGRGLRGGGLYYPVFAFKYHPHPDPLPSRERGVFRLFTKLLTVISFMVRQVVLSLP
jgi:hypothetical protein